MNHDLVFIASGGRTGTTFFGKRLSGVIEDCWSEHEPDVLVLDRAKSLPRIRQFGLWHMVFGRLLGQSGLRPIGHRLMAGRIDEQTAIAQLRAQRATYHAGIPKSLVVESNGRFWMVAPVLNKAFPGSRLIGVVRDPRDWVESWVRHQPDRHTRGFMQWFPLGPLTPAQVGDARWAGRWPSLDQFGRLAWDWRCITGRLEEAQQTSPEKVRIYRFEDLFGHADEIIRQCVEFAAFDGKYPVSDLGGFTEKKANSSAGPRRDWRHWPSSDVLLLDQICGEQMREYGYGLETEWLAQLEEARAEVQSA